MSALLHTLDTLWAALHGDSSEGCYVVSQWTEDDGTTPAKLDDPAGVYRVEVRSHETPITEDPAYSAQAHDAGSALATIVKTMRQEVGERREILNRVLHDTGSFVE